MLRSSIALLTCLACVGLAPAGERLPPLPTAVSSLGAAVWEGYLYVYGGHCGEPHHYDTQTVLGTFQRLKLDGGSAWENLPGGPILQGMNLVAKSGKIYRVGGMQPRNKPGEPTDIHSVAEVAAYDIQKGVWENLPPMPSPRSSHDVVVVGDTLYVVGGWGMGGDSGKSSFHTSTYALDLTAPKPAWRSIEQPFQRRALTATAVGDKIFVLGGLNAKGKTSVEVDILDTTTGNWTKGPDFPGSGRMGFSPAAATVEGHLLLNTAEGPVYRLVDGKSWEKIAQAQDKRMVARLLNSGNQAILVGGANQSNNVANLEVFSLDKSGKVSAQR